MHFHSPVLYGRLSRITRWLPCKQLVHIHIETEPQLYGWAFRSPPDAIITCANFLRDAVQEGLSLCPKATPPIYSVQNAIQLDRYRPNGREQARKRIGMDTRSAVVLMLANLAPHKGQHIAIQAVENLVQRGFDVECWLAGEDRDAIGYESKLMHQAKSAGLGERVRFLGYRNDAEQLLQASDFFILPSTHEGLPLSILEAQACKVPVIASPVAGIPEVITDGVTGFLASPDRPEDYADSIAMLMEATEKRSQITEAAYKHVSAYNSWQHYCKSITEVYDSLS
ncbi:glycosyltransferase family 4 protein [Roseiconus lacunae]|uniref:glycosyltransferase family 4 protein n=1 Tax=Roseiconus lacunae TaxID=2605694 RepID=UPI0021BCEF89|nr:glycosyltransferase family 4 protein [Roseiconus lacunae]